VHALSPSTTVIKNTTMWKHAKYYSYTTKEKRTAENELVSFHTSRKT